MGANEVGLDPNEFKEALNSNECKDLVEKDFHSAEQNKIWTIPSYVGDRGVIQIHHYKDMPSIDEIVDLL